MGTVEEDCVSWGDYVGVLYNAGVRREGYRGVGGNVDFNLPLSLFFGTRL